MPSRAAAPTAAPHRTPALHRGFATPPVFRTPRPPAPTAPLFFDSRRPTAGPKQSQNQSATAQQVYQHARRLGLTGKLGSTPQPTSGNAFYDALGDKSSALQRGVWDIPRTATALMWFEEYLLATERQPFIPALGSEQLGGTLYNRETLDRFAVYVRGAAPKGRTKNWFVSADCISGYVSAVYVLRCREAGYDVAPTSRTSADQKKEMLKKEAAGERDVGRGFRASHFERLHQRSPPLSTADRVERAAGLAAHNLMLRGGEVGVPDTTEGPPEPNRIITWTSFDWKAPSVDSGFRPWCFARIVPIKNPSGRAKAHPIPLSRGHDGTFGSCGTCAYDAIAAAWWTRRGPLGTPFPLDERGRPADG